MYREISILYVEDDPMDQDLTLRQLRRQAPHLKVSAANSESEATDILAEKTFDMILTDYLLPDGDGISLITWIIDHGLSCVPIVITGQGDEKIAASAIKAGAEDYIVKRSGYLDQLPLILEKAYLRSEKRKAFYNNIVDVLYCGNSLSSFNEIEKYAEKHASHFRFQYASDYGSSINRLKKDSFHACIVETIFSDMTGLDLFKEISLHDAVVPTVLVANRTDEEIAAQSLRLGISAYIVTEGDYVNRLIHALENAVSKDRLEKREKKFREEIAVRKSTEAVLAQTNDLLNAISRIQSKYISQVEFVEIFDLLLTDLLSLTRSEYGFIGEIINTSGGQPYLKTHAITNIAWNKETQAFYEKNVREGLEFFNLKTLFGAVISTGKTVISNDPTRDPRRGGLPKGHPPLKAFLGVPLYTGDKLIGMVGLANRPNGYDKGVKDYLEPYLSTCRQIIGAYAVAKERQKDQARLEQSEKRLSEAQRIARMGNWEWNIADNTLYWSDEIYRIFGLDSRQFKETYKAFQEHVHPDDRAFVKNSVNEALYEKKPYRIDHRIVRPDGTERIVHEQARVSFDDNGKAIRMIGTVSDITDRKERENEIRNKVHELTEINSLARKVNSVLSKEHVVSYSYECIYSALTPDLVVFYLLDDDRLILHGNQTINPVMTQGMPEMKRVGECLCGTAVEKRESIFSIDIHKDSRCTLDECKEAGMRSFGALPLIAGGAILGVLGIGSLRKRDFSQQAAFLETLSNQIALGIQNALLYEKVGHQVKKLKRHVVEIKNAEEHIRDSKKMLQSVFDGVSDPLILLDEDMTVMMLNSAASKYYKTAFKDAIGKPCHLAFKGAGNQCEGCQVLSAIKGTEPVSIEREGFMDSERVEQVVTYPLEVKKNPPGSVIMRITDITESKEMERKLIQSEKMASLGLLTAGIAHEINNPNSFITFNIPIMRRYVTELLPVLKAHASTHPDFAIAGMSYDEFRDDILELIENIEHGSSRINKTVANLRSFARKKDKIERSWVEVRDVIERAVSICRGEIQKTVKSINIEIPKDLPEIYVDPDTLEQVLVNLIINAAHASDKEKSWIKVKAGTNNKDLNGVIIETIDNGCGMDEEILERVFDPFFTTKQSGSGTGLGLSLCENMINEMGGSIEVESEPEAGSTFRIRLYDSSKER